MAGCGSLPSEYLDDMQLLPVAEELVELRLGRFTIPVPALQRDQADLLVMQNRLQVVFVMFAVVRPDDELTVRHAWERQQGRLSDDILRTCRQATLDELTEPSLATLKARLTDVASRRLGRDHVRRIVLDNLVVLPLEPNRGL